MFLSTLSLAFLSCSGDEVVSVEYIDHGEVLCEAPVEGIERFSEQAVERGITPDPITTEMSPYGIPSGLTLAAVDGDNDGDIDLFFPSLRGHPQVYENDGSGNFRPGPYSSAGTTLPEDTMPFSLVDMNGDDLPDLITFAFQGVLFAPNLGGLRFGPNTAVFAYEPDNSALVVTGNWGDADGDGDLDLFIPRMDLFSAEQESLLPEPSFDLLLLNHEGGLLLGGQYGLAEGMPGLSMSATFTDRDADGDQDILVLSDGAQFGLPRSSFYTNNSLEGELALEDIAAEIGTDVAVSGMGVDVVDINGDGVFDYCYTDLSQPDCLVSVESDRYVLAGRSLGLIAPPMEENQSWSGWSIDVVDYDNDGLLDAAASAGFGFEARVSDGLDYNYQPNALWRGVEGGGFDYVEGAIGAHADTHHYGMVSADLDGDGYLELLFSGPDSEVLAYWNACGAGAWLEVDLRGLPVNRMGYGARVEVVAGDEIATREMGNLRTFSQGPGRLHFGLGDVEEVDLRVAWPDGTVTEIDEVPTRRRVTVLHPDAEE